MKADLGCKSEQETQQAQEHVTSISTFLRMLWLVTSHSKYVDTRAKQYVLNVLVVNSLVGEILVLSSSFIPILLSIVERSVAKGYNENVQLLPATGLYIPLLYLPSNLIEY